MIKGEGGGRIVLLIGREGASLDLGEDSWTNANLERGFIYS